MTRTRLWWWVHHWVGLKLTLLLSFVLLSGTLAVVSNEVDWLLRPALRVDTHSVDGTVNWPAIARSLAAREPAAAIVSLESPEDRWFAVKAVVSRPHGDHGRRLGFVYLHPVTGAVQGTGHWVSVQRVLRNLHRRLMLPTEYGVPIVSSLALLLLATLVSSLIVYRRWWRGILHAIRLTRPRLAWGDFHRLSGVWSLCFLLLIILTGLWYLVESLGGAARPIQPHAAQRTHATTPSLAQSVLDAPSLDSTRLAAALPQHLAAARAAFPQLQIQRIVFPTAKSPAFRFEGQHAAILVRPRANTVWTALSSAEPLLVHDARQLNAHQRISEMADPLHFGDFGGLWTKLPWFLFGALLTGLTISGAVIYSLRLRAARGVIAADVGHVATVWHGMGAWRWPAAGLLASAMLLLPTLFSTT